MAGIRKRDWTTKTGQKKSCYEITYYIDGKLYRKSGYTTKQEAQNDIQNVTKTINSSISFKQLCEEYLKEKTFRCKNSTIIRYKRYINSNLSHLHNKKARDIRKKDIENTINILKQANMANKTINCILIFLSSIFKFGIENKLFSDNPLEKVSKLPLTKGKLQYLNEDEVNTFIRYIKTFPLNKQVPLFVAINTGMRIGELLALEWTDIDFKQKQIAINKQVWNNTITTPKTVTSNRIIDVPDSVLDLLRQLKEENKVLSKIVFRGESNGYMKRNLFVKNWFKKVMKQINHEDYSFHCLRHTYVTLLLSKGVPIKYVQQQVGHSTADTLLKTYTHVLPSSTHQAMNILNNIEYEQNMSIAKFKH